MVASKSFSTSFILSSSFSLSLCLSFAISPSRVSTYVGLEKGL